MSTDIDPTKLVSIVFLQGDDYEQAVDEINNAGGSTDAAVNYLAQWDFGTETDSNADGSLWDITKEHAPYHRVESEAGVYFLLADHSMGTYSLYRAPLPESAHLFEGQI